MKALTALAALSAALLTAGCITVIDADGRDDYGWHGQNAEPFDVARDACRDSTRGGPHSDAFISCMKTRGWTRG